jgi:hypothetical protein
MPDAAVLGDRLGQLQHIVVGCGGGRRRARGAANGRGFARLFFLGDEAANRGEDLVHRWNGR